MDELKMAIDLVPEVRLLYKLGIIDIAPSLMHKAYIQLTEEKFRELFPEIEPDAEGHLVTYVNDIRIIALTDETERSCE